MRKWMVVSLIGGLALVPALAFADVDIDVDIHKTKDKRVVEKLFKFKQAFIFAKVFLFTKDAAESEALVNQTNQFNFDENGFLGDTPPESSSIGLVVGGNDGITGVNLASGNMNNQANVVSVAVVTATDAFRGAFAESQAGADQKNFTNFYQSLGESFSSSDLTVSENSGITGVNQSSGQMNNQANVVSVAASTLDRGGIALSEADLGQVNSRNRALIDEFGATSRAFAQVSGNSGITGVNQSSGHMNNQANVVSVAATR